MASCLSIDPAVFVNSDASSYGFGCAAHDTLALPHCNQYVPIGTLVTGNAQSPSYYITSPNYCGQKWCYVDPSTPGAISSFFYPGVSYSYAACDAVDFFTPSFPDTFTTEDRTNCLCRTMHGAFKPGDDDYAFWERDFKGTYTIGADGSLTPWDYTLTNPFYRSSCKTDTAYTPAIEDIDEITTPRALFDFQASALGSNLWSLRNHGALSIGNAQQLWLLSDNKY